MTFPRDIYILTHNPTQKSYIGSSWWVERRIKQHLWELRKGSHHVEDMQKDFDEYGEDYTVSILETCNTWEEHYREYYWMQKYETCTRGVGYNYKDNAKAQFRKFITEDQGSEEKDPGVFRRKTRELIPFKEGLPPEFKNDET